MVTALGRKTTVEHWDSAWQGPISYRLPSALNVSVADIQKQLTKVISPGHTYLELGCAPGKMLSWVSAKLKANVAGIDYSERGLLTAQKLFSTLGLKGDLRCEDVFSTSFPISHFDVVASFGLVEHFDDPSEIVRQHVLLTKPGGITLVVIPNYGGIYGRLQRYFDAENLAIHNLEIMCVDGLTRVAPHDLISEFSIYPAGRFSPWMISFSRRLPGWFAKPLTYGLNLLALLQPVQIRPLCPMLILRMKRRT